LEAQQSEIERNFGMSRYSGKRILITGGTSGIGFAGAQRIAREGGMVAVTGRNPIHLEETRRLLPPDALVIENNAADPTAAGALLREIETWGKLDGLWLNAGYAAVRSPEQVNAAFFDEMMAANVRGPVLQLAQLSSVLRDGSSIVVTSSVAAYERSPSTSVYAATKGAQLSLVRSWAAALAPRRIRVNALVPGPIESGLRNFLSTSDRLIFEQHVVSQVPLGRLGTPDEAAAVALFLLSDDASFVTGSQYAVDGGMMMT
jgi:NAD(P)-dependent dehydrogenase (short-subunit alcohol dehydrogenase family)